MLLLRVSTKAVQRIMKFQFNFEFLPFFLLLTVPYFTLLLSVNCSNSVWGQSVHCRFLALCQRGGMGICPSSVSQLSQNLLGGFLSNFAVGCPGPYVQKLFEVLKTKCFSIFHVFFFIFSMGAKSWKHYFSLKSFLNFPNFSWIFFSLGLTKVLVLGFWNIEFTTFHDFLFCFR